MPVRKFETNVPQQVALKFSTGKRVEGKYGDQLLYTLTDGSVMYVPPVVEAEIQKLGIQPNQTFGLCKRQVNGSRRDTRWELEVPERKPQGAAALLDRAPDLEGIPDAPANSDIPTRLEYALKTALQAAKKAEQYSLEIGHPVQFDKDDIRLMAQTLVINAEKGRAA